MSKVGQGHAIDVVDQIDTIRRDTELKYGAGFLQVGRRGDSRHVPAPKLDKSCKEAFAVLDRSFVEKTDISGESGIPVVDNRFSTDNQVFHIVVGQTAEEIQSIAG